ncbi:MAG TPA: dipeptidase PepE [Rhodothermales bacterium]|nr:dipeptidase PepE [Rhodothermales bacterium]HRR07286.1 dipeptidase PepE [Rhodothermales bacterium]
MMKRLLLLSNSRSADEEPFYWAADTICDFFGAGVQELLFIPYAGVTLGWDNYTDWVKKALAPLGYRVLGLHTQDDPRLAVQRAAALIVGGGNTFHLLYHLYQNNLIETIRERVLVVGIPYMGWSAGGNVACPTLHTTNDMPIIMPPSFNALNLIPFQINPHYTALHPPGHMGETRDDRIKEFIEVNRSVKVAGLPEGCLFRIEGDQIHMQGRHYVRIFQYGAEIKDLDAILDFSFLLEPN